MLYYRSKNTHIYYTCGSITLAKFTASQIRIFTIILFCDFIFWNSQQNQSLCEKVAQRKLSEHERTGGQIRVTNPREKTQSAVLSVWSQFIILWPPTARTRRYANVIFLAHTCARQTRLKWNCVLTTYLLMFCQFKDLLFSLRLYYYFSLISSVSDFLLLSPTD